MVRKLRQIPVDEIFYRKFDAKRRMMQKQMGLKNLSNRKFSQLVGSKGDIIIPKISNERLIRKKKIK